LIPGWKESKIAPKTGLDLLVRFHNLLKIAKFFETNNDSFQEQLVLLWDVLDHGLVEHGQLTVLVRRGAVFVNRTRVKFDYATFHVYKFMVGEFSGRNIGTMTFMRGLDRDELAAFVFSLARREGKSDESFEDLVSDLDSQGFDHIDLGPVLAEDKETGQERRAARMYLLGIAHLKEIFEKEKEVLSFNVTRRWIQSIFNHIQLDESFMHGLTNIKNFDEYTLNHSVNVCVLSVALGRRMGLSRRELVELGLSAFLHDLGKLDIPKEILDKPAKLDPDEWAIMEKHSHLGAERLIEIKIERGIPSRAVQVAMEHHIQPDLGGYPKYQRKRRLSLYSKIVKITDFFDAMTTKRVYRPVAFSREAVLAMMKEKSGEEFDDVILKAFTDMIGAYPVGSLVALDSGEIGIVFEANAHAAFTLRPKVKIVADARGNKIDGPLVDLTEVDPQSRVFRRTILKALDPEKYHISVADYFIARLT
jgi:HD-GYP domain-containing protein (c-di-GMP phosphodiesterase class II)